MVRRSVAALAAFWIVVVLSAPTAVSACAMLNASHHVEHAHMPVDASASHQAGSHSAPHHDSTPLCPCLGDCCCAAAVAVVPDVADAVIQIRAVAFVAVAMSARSDHRPATVDHARPPTVGPPLLTA